MAADPNKSAVLVGKMMAMLMSEGASGETASLASRTLAGVIGAKVGTEKAVSEMEVDDNTVTVIVLEGRRASEFLSDDDKLRADKDGEGIVGNDYEVHVGGDPTAVLEKLINEAADASDDDSEGAKHAKNVHEISFEVLRLIARRGKACGLDPDVGVAAVLTMATGIELVASIRDDMLKGDTEDEQIDNFVKVMAGGVKSFAKLFFATTKDKAPDNMASFVRDIMEGEKG